MAFKFGPGLTGKSTIVLVSLILTGAIAIACNSIIGVCIFLILAYGCWRWFEIMLVFIKDNPHEAMSDGEVYLGLKKLEHQTKDGRSFIDVSPTNTTDNPQAKELTGGPAKDA